MLTGYFALPDSQHRGRFHAVESFYPDNYRALCGWRPRPELNFFGLLQCAEGLEEISARGWSCCARCQAAIQRRGRGGKP